MALMSSCEGHITQLKMLTLSFLLDILGFDLYHGNRSMWHALKSKFARVVELADSLDSGSSVQYGRGGSSPPSRTKIENDKYINIRL